MSREVTLMLLMLVLLVSGCLFSRPGEVWRADDRLEALERESRAREQAILKLQAEVTAISSERYELKQLLEEARSTVKSLKTGGEAPPEQPFRFEAVKVDFGFLTCAIDLDKKKGDDAIAAYVYLYDQYDSSIKAAGAFHFELFDLARKEGHLIQAWSFEPEQAAMYWQRFPACYQFKLPFGGEVTAKKGVLKVAFRRPGKETLTATREVTIELP